jgi:hypothetical protein
MPEEIKQEEEVVDEDLDKVPLIRTPLASCAWLGVAILGIVGLMGAMLYAWSQVL